MSAIFADSAEGLTQAAIAPASDDLTLMGWFYIDSLPASAEFRTFFYTGNDPATYTEGAWIGHVGDPGGPNQGKIEIFLNSDSSLDLGPALPFGWHHITYRRTGTTQDLLLNGVVVATLTQDMSAQTHTHLMVGSDTIPTSWLGSKAAFVRGWNAALTLAEIVAETYSAVAVRATDLLLDAPLLSDLLDDSGNTNDFIASGGTITFGAQPPLPSFTSSASSVGSAVSSLTWSHTSNGNPLYVMTSIFINAGGVDSVNRISGITFNGVALTLGGLIHVNGNSMAWWRLAAPATTTANIVITLASSQRLTAGAINRTGWPSTLGEHLFVANTGRTLTSGAPTSVSISPGAGAEILQWVSYDQVGQTLTLGDHQYPLWNQGASTTAGDQQSVGALSSGVVGGVSSFTSTLTVVATPWEHWGHAALSYGSTTFQKVTQLVELVSWGEDADADPPPDVTPCSGNGTVAAGTNPAADTALSTMTTPLAWIEVVVGGTTYRMSAVAINDPTPKQPWVLSMGRLARGLSDGLGSFESAVMRVRLSDAGRVLRGLMNTGVLIRQPFSAYVVDLTTLQASGTPRRVFHGVVRTFRPLSELEFEIEAEDRFTFATSAFATEKKVPARLVTSQISDRNPIDRVIGKPVTIILGACSDEDQDDPVGVVPLKYIASETPAEHDDNLHKFLGCGHALKNIQAIYLANYVSGGDEPTTRIKAPTSAYGTVLFVPHQAGWFGAGNYTDQNDERYTYVYGLDAHIAIELARSERIPLLMNCCGAEDVGDSTGVMISNPARCFALVLNNRLAQEATANWLAQLSLGTYTLLDMTSFEAAATICAAREYLCAGIIGADDQQLDWRETGEWFCTDFDFDWGVNRHGQIILAMLDLTSAYSSAPVFTDQNHVLKGSLSIDPKTDEVENEIQFVYRRNYVEALHNVSTREGSRPNRDPYDGKWFSGPMTIADETVITEMGGRPLGLRQSRVQEYHLIRDTATAEAVAERRLDRLKRPRAEVTFTVTLRDGDGVDLGDVIKLTHFAGATATGYTTRRLQVRRIEDDLDVFTRTFVCRDVENLLP